METKYRLLRPSALNRLGEIKLPLQILSPHLTNQPSTSLVRSLLLVCKEIESLEKPKQWHTQHVACITRRVKVMSLLFQELNDKEELILPPSATVSLRELLIIVEKSKVILQVLNNNRRSRIWRLVESGSISRRLDEVRREMAKALEMLPLGLLPISEDIREHLDLLRRQATKTPSASDNGRNDEESQLQHEVDEAIRMLEAEKPQPPDPGRLRAAFEKLGLGSFSKCRAEIRKLQDEAAFQADAGAGVSALGRIQRLISLVTYTKSVLFADDAKEEEEGEEDCELAPCSPTFRDAAALTNSRSMRSYSCIPEEMKCPISLDLMRDPVIVASGHTYDRASISEWLDSGHCKCPLSGQKLPRHPLLTPNYALRSLISEWCDRHKFPFHFSREGNSAAAQEAIKSTASYLVGKLATGDREVQTQAAYELRLLAKCGNENRKYVAEAGAIPFLVHLLSSLDPKAQENAVTALLNLSIYDNNKVLIMAAHGAVDGIVGVLERGGTMESRENAAATLFSLSTVDNYKMVIGGKAAAIPALVRLLNVGSTRGRKDAATALYNLSGYNGNTALVIRADAVPVLVNLVVKRDENSGAGVTYEALCVLSVLLGCAEGLETIGCNSVPLIPTLIDLVRVGSEKEKEKAIDVLAAMCRSGGDCLVRRLATQFSESFIPALQIVAWMGSPRAKKKATSLLKLVEMQLLKP